MSAAPVQTDPRTIPLPTLLSRLAEELGVLGGLAEDLQATIGELARSAATDAGSLRDVQQIDLISQRLQALSVFTDTIGEGLSGGWRVDASKALAAVPLSALAARLAGEEPVLSERDSGELDFFEEAGG